MFWCFDRDLQSNHFCPKMWNSKLIIQNFRPVQKIEIAEFQFLTKAVHKRSGTDQLKVESFQPQHENIDAESQNSIVWLKFIQLFFESIYLHTTFRIVFKLNLGIVRRVG